MKASLVKESSWLKLLMVFLFAILGAFIFLVLGLSLLPVFYNISMQDVMTILNQPVNQQIEVFKFLQAFNTIGTYLIPAVLAAWLFHPYPALYLAMDNFPRRAGLVILLAIVIALSGVAVSDILYRFSSNLIFPEFLLPLEDYFRQTQKMVEEHISLFLRMENFLDFAEIFLILAVLPALCEEALFRGVVQPLFIKAFKNVHIGIIFTSVVFGLLHQQFYSFLSITALSLVLGYLRYWSGSLWVPVIMHLVNNGSIIVAVYFFDVPLEDIQSGSEDISTTASITGLILFTLSMFSMWWILNIKNRGKRFGGI